MSIGVPIKVMHEAEGHVITCELVTGEVYRGKLVEAEDNMNCQLSNISVTYRDGRQANLDNVYIRGSKVRFLILPDMLKNAPMFKAMVPAGPPPRGGGRGFGGRGRSQVIRAGRGGRGGGGFGGRGGGGRGGGGGGFGGGGRGGGGGGYGGGGRGGGGGGYGGGRY